ncbi:hypothetical protein KQI42_05940 [Tissierella sp. MSJ-40]|uniref:Flavoprotein domain-containing protein n=1 Tax=Tissierella simiarum TaxID=2841534 RepID=A0ABS6E3P5_9FIRM|nr:flavoprotein [Tissierella simiarum]MBU5437538.1 hypothetical protein [Tissierella simiarum]
MNKLDIKKIVEEVLVEYIAEKVIEKLIERKKRAIVIFTGASIGFNQSIKSLQSLKRDGWDFEIVMSKGAERALTVNLIKELLSVDNVITEDFSFNMEKLLEENNFIIVPTLTVKTTSKIANCIIDNPTTSIISRFIMNGRPVIASINGCCPDNEERNKFGFSPTESYKIKLRENIEAIKSYGVSLTISENLDKKTNEMFFRTYGIPQLGESKKLSIKDNKVINIESKVITRSTILDNSIYNVINLRKDVIITDLAKEEAEKRNIRLIKM